MTKFFCKLLLLLTTIGLSGCITSPYTATSEALTKYKRIGVISTAAQTFNRTYAGFTIGHAFESIDISSWGLDDIFEEKMSKEVIALKKYELVKVNVKRSEFLNIRPSSGILGHLGAVVTPWDSYSSILGNYCKTNQVEAILLLHPLAVVYSDSKKEAVGVGMYARPYIIGENDAHIFVNVAISLVDCTNLKPVSSKELLAFHFDKLGKYELDTYPNGNVKLFTKPVPYEVAKSPLNKLDKKLFESFKEQLIELTNDSWKPNIRQTLLGIDVDINRP